MMDPFKSQIRPFLESISEIPDELWNSIEPKLVRRPLNEDEIIQEIGDPADYIWFLANGALKVEQIDEESGDLKLIYFNSPSISPLAGVLESHITGKPSDVKITSLCDSIVFEIEYSFIENLYSSSIQAERLGRMIMQQQYLHSLELGRHRQDKGHKSKYLKFKEKFSDIIEHVNDKELASYLGFDYQHFNKNRKKWD